MVDDPSTVDVTRLVAEFHPAVYRYAYRLTGSVPDAEDLAQQTFLIAHEKIGQLRSVDCARSWLFTILRHLFGRWLQKRSETPAGDLSLNLNSLPGEIPPEDTIDREQLQRALDQLPAAYRLVVTMFYFEDCSYREIAEELELPLGTVMSRLARAKAQLRAELFEPVRDGQITRRP